MLPQLVVQAPVGSELISFVDQIPLAATACWRTLHKRNPPNLSAYSVNAEFQHNSRPTRSRLLQGVDHWQKLKKMCCNASSQAIDLVENTLQSVRCDPSADFIKPVQHFGDGTFCPSDSAILFHVWNSRSEARKFHESLRRIHQAMTEHLVPAPLHALLAVLLTFQGRLVTALWLPPIADGASFTPLACSPLWTVFDVLRSALGNMISRSQLLEGRDGRVYVIDLLKSCLVHQLLPREGGLIPSCLGDQGHALRWELIRASVTVKPEHMMPFLELKVPFVAGELIRHFQVPEIDRADALKKANRAVQALKDGTFSRLLHEHGVNVCSAYALHVVLSGMRPSRDDQPWRKLALELVTAEMLYRAIADVVVEEMDAATVPGYATAEIVEMERLENANSVLTKFLGSAQFFGDVVMPKLRRKFGTPEEFDIQRNSIAFCLRAIIELVAQKLGMHLGENRRSFTGFSTQCLLTSSSRKFVPSMEQRQKFHAKEQGLELQYPRGKGRGPRFARLLRLMCCASMEDTSSVIDVTFSYVVGEEVARSLRLPFSRDDPNRFIQYYAVMVMVAAAVPSTHLENHYKTLLSLHHAALESMDVIRLPLSRFDDLQAHQLRSRQVALDASILGSSISERSQSSDHSELQRPTQSRVFSVKEQNVAMDQLFDGVAFLNAADSLAGIVYADRNRSSSPIAGGCLFVAAALLKRSEEIRDRTSRTITHIWTQHVSRLLIHAEMPSGMGLIAADKVADNFVSFLRQDLGQRLDDEPRKCIKVCAFLSSTVAMSQAQLLASTQCEPVANDPWIALAYFYIQTIIPKVQDGNAKIQAFLRCLFLISCRSFLRAEVLIKAPPDKRHEYFLDLLKATANVYGERQIVLKIVLLKAPLELVGLLFGCGYADVALQILNALRMEVSGISADDERLISSFLAKPQVVLIAIRKAVNKWRASIRPPLAVLFNAAEKFRLIIQHTEEVFRRAISIQQETDKRGLVKAENDRFFYRILSDCEAFRRGNESDEEAQAIRELLPLAETSERLALQRHQQRARETLMGFVATAISTKSFDLGLSEERMQFEILEEDYRSRYERHERLLFRLLRLQVTETNSRNRILAEEENHKVVGGSLQAEYDASRSAQNMEEFCQRLHLLFAKCELFFDALLKESHVRYCLILDASDQEHDVIAMKEAVRRRRNVPAERGHEVPEERSRDSEPAKMASKLSSSQAVSQSFVLDDAVEEPFLKEDAPRCSSPQKSIDQRQTSEKDPAQPPEPHETAKTKLPHSQTEMVSQSFVLDDAVGEPPPTTKEASGKSWPMNHPPHSSPQKAATIPQWLYERSTPLERRHSSDDEDGSFIDVHAHAQDDQGSKDKRVVVVASNIRSTADHSSNASLSDHLDTSSRASTEQHDGQCVKLPRTPEEQEIERARVVKMDADMASLWNTTAKYQSKRAKMTMNQSVTSPKVKKIGGAPNKSLTPLKKR